MYKATVVIYYNILATTVACISYTRVGIPHESRYNNTLRILYRYIIEQLVTIKYIL